MCAEETRLRLGEKCKDEFVLCLQEIMVGSMYQAETPSGLCKYIDNERGKQWHASTSLEIGSPSFQFQECESQHLIFVKYYKLMP